MPCFQLAYLRKLECFKHALPVICRLRKLECFKHALPVICRLRKLEYFKHALVEIRVFQAYACGGCCDTETSTSLPMLRTCASAPTSFFPVLPHCGGMSLCALSACTHVDVVTSSWLKFDEKTSSTFTARIVLISQIRST